MAPCAKEIVMNVIIKKIVDEMRWVDIKPYSHNIVGCLLTQLSEFKTKEQMEDFITEIGLRELGW
jgi:hypothetical protein